MYGTMREPDAAPLFSPRGIRLAAEAAAGKDNSYFECLECAAKRKRRRLYLYGGLAALVGLSILTREFVGG